GRRRVVPRADPRHAARVDRVAPGAGEPGQDAAKRGNAVAPAYAAAAPSSSSIRSSWVYFATRSDRAGAPVLLCPASVATARSAIVVSSVSPDRCDRIAV